MTALLRHYWLVMTYACDRCGHRIPFYLEDGCEGPRDRDVAPPAEWETWRSSASFPLPKTVPQTASGRFVLPVPFVAARCRKCAHGALQHIAWGSDRKVSTTEPPADAGQFHYPDDWTAYHACGRPVMPAGAAT